MCDVCVDPTPGVLVNVSGAKHNVQDIERRDMKVDKGGATTASENPHQHAHKQAPTRGARPPPEQQDGLVATPHVQAVRRQSGVMPAKKSP